ncbi:NAD(P)H-binding protein [Demequina sp. NBRC 110056]|uniref:NAD(P)H-binding protein n=1 Tax=Demequina sp. NBRC 110056 TaxID=1570345 RepID=UPI000A045634|nr:NAD(P)H-binding protein [Demequina sp. NBRC 110056]
MARVVVIGATGSVGRVVVPALTAAGHHVVAYVRDPARASALLGEVTVAVGDLDDQPALAAAVGGADAVVMVHGAAGSTPPEEVDYGAVPAVLRAVGAARPHVVLMTSMAVTHASGSWREAMHWKRRGERLLRASGLPATVIRPGWFDLEPEGHRAVALEQGDRTPVDSRRPVARAQIADAVVASLACPAVVGVTFELFAAPGEPERDWCARLAGLVRDEPGSLDAALDPREPALADEPARLRRDMEDLRRRRG